MTDGRNHDFTRLWKEQVDPRDEQAASRALAKEIVRGARRRRSRDLWLAIVTAGMIAMALLVASAPTPFKLALAAATVLLIWTIWRGQQLLKATRALVGYAPRDFVKSAIDNTKAELSYSTACLSVAIVLLIFFFVIATDSWRIDSVYPVLADLPERHLWRAIASVTSGVLINIYFIREHLKLRAQLRTLEKMRAEWEAEDMRDLAEEDGR